MSISVYNLKSGDIVLGKWRVALDDIIPGNAGAYGSAILSPVGDVGNGYKYIVRWGYFTYVTPMYVWATSSASAKATICGKTVSKKVNFSYNTFNNVQNKYLMFSETATIILPYSTKITGNVQLSASNMYNPENWSYGGTWSKATISVESGSSTTPSAPIPTAPKIYQNNPTNITATSAYLYAYFDGNSDQRNYYEIGLKNVSNNPPNAQDFILKPAYSGTSGSREYVGYTWSGIQPETNYTVWAGIYAKTGGTNKGHVDKSFTTLSKRKCYIKYGGSWHLGKLYIKGNGKWQSNSSATAYIKKGSTWTKAKQL